MPAKCCEIQCEAENKTRRRGRIKGRLGICRRFATRTSSHLAYIDLERVPSWLRDARLDTGYRNRYICNLDLHPRDSIYRMDWLFRRCLSASCMSLVCCSGPAGIKACVGRRLPSGSAREDIVYVSLATHIFYIMMSGLKYYGVDGRTIFHYTPLEVTKGGMSCTCLLNAAARTPALCG